MSAARLNSRALTVRGTLPQIGSFSLGAKLAAISMVMRNAMGIVSPDLPPDFAGVAMTGKSAATEDPRARSPDRPGGASCRKCQCCGISLYRWRD